MGGVIYIRAHGLNPVAYDMMHPFLVISIFAAQVTQYLVCMTIEAIYPHWKYHEDDIICHTALLCWLKPGGIVLIKFHCSLCTAYSPNWATF